MRLLASSFFAFLLSAAIAACADDDPSPVEVCEADADHACCQDSECGKASLCDFDYVCSPAPKGKVSCSEGSGDRTCHVRCDAREVDMPCVGGGVCKMITRFQGGDNGMDAYACY